MFNLAVENLREVDYFSEKVLDAFQTFTVPIYFGCPNISDYFNADGIIVIRDEYDFLRVANSLTPKDYWDRLPAMIDNQRVASSYQNGLRRIQQLILNFSQSAGNILA